MKARWEAWCARHGVTAADGVRQLVYDVLSQSESPDGVPGPEHRRVPVDGHRERIEIRLTQDELDVARSCAGQGGRRQATVYASGDRDALVVEQIMEQARRRAADCGQSTERSACH
ncbi:hypothetical protein PQQ64_29060 [Paraburkholderia graminis]|uniref:hypothetical protein n=1 Tax=Paraburkholderia graminis TaxID=60548 RepID=UPI0038B8A1E8